MCLDFIQLDHPRITESSASLGRALNIYETNGPLTIIVPFPSKIDSQALSTALRIAHDLDVFLKLDSQILPDTVAMSLIKSESSTLKSNLIILGGIENAVTRSLLQLPTKDIKTEFGLSEDGEWTLRGAPISKMTRNEDIGILFTHPHPFNPSAAAVILSGTKSLGGGMERALRLLAPRTGLIVPDWILSGKAADRFGICGILGAGFVKIHLIKMKTKNLILHFFYRVWDTKWRWNEPMSWVGW